MIHSSTRQSLVSGGRYYTDRPDVFMGRYMTCVVQQKEMLCTDINYWKTASTIHIHLQTSIDVKEIYFLGIMLGKKYLQEENPSIEFSLKGNPGNATSS